MIGSILFLSLSFAVGVCTIGFFDWKRKLDTLERLAFAAVLGLGFGGMAVLVGSVLARSRTAGIALYIVAGAAWCVWRRNELRTAAHDIRRAFSFARIIRNPAAWGLTLICALYSMYIATLLFWSGDHTLRTNYLSWGDVALHVSLAERFATADPFTLAHPLVAGERLAYPMLADFISGIFRSLGADQVWSLRIPLLWFGLSAIVLLFSLASRILHSRNAAVLALVLILFGSGFGFVRFFEDMQRAWQGGGGAAVRAALTRPPHTYTHLDRRTGGIPPEQQTNDDIVWIVPLISFLGHQKSFVVGLALWAVIVLGIILYGKELQFWRYGVIAGVLPFAHGHTLLALGLFMAALFPFFLKQWRAWIGFGAMALLIALPQILFLFSGRGETSALATPHLFFGWMTCAHTVSWLRCDALANTDSNAFIFWTKNFGMVFLAWIVMLMIAAVSLWHTKHRAGEDETRPAIPFLIASLVLFAVPNVLVFQPWEFDNNKILFYWWVTAILFGAAPLFMRLMRTGVMDRILAAVLIFFSVFAGGFDVWAHFSAVHVGKSYGYADGLEENRTTAEWIRAHTAPNALFLAVPSVDPVPLFLAGRPVYLGYEGWVWSHGIDANPHRSRAEAILSGDLTRACEAGIDYILTGSDLHQYFPAMNESAILQKGEAVFSVPGFLNRKIVRIPCEK